MIKSHLILNGLSILGTSLFCNLTNIIKKCHIYIQTPKANTMKIDWLLGLTPTAVWAL
jgi:hypothetical protein